MGLNITGEFGAGSFLPVIGSIKTSVIVIAGTSNIGEIIDFSGATLNQS
jgi:hypothetical protein